VILVHDLFFSLFAKLANKDSAVFGAFGKAGKDGLTFFLGDFYWHGCFFTS